MFKSVIAALGLLIVLGGCGAKLDGLAGPARAILNAETAEERAVAREKVRLDLAEALRAAEVHEDKVAAACWRGLLVKLEALQGDYFTTVKGVASGFQKTRNIRRKFTDGISEDIAIACAALHTDTRSLLLGLVRAVGLPVL